MMFEPLAGRRDVEVTDRRTKKDYAECLRKLADETYPDADVIVLVQDNLHTHSPASLHEAVESMEAKRLTEQFEFHDPPPRGRWLDMAEIELGIPGRQCLSRPIDNVEDLRREAKSRDAARDQAGIKATWQFTTTDARIALKRLYPSVDE